MVETLAARPVIDGDPAAMMGTALDPIRRPTPRTEGVELPDAAEAVFARALALDPRARQRDAGVFWNELLAALQVPDSERGVALPRDSRAEEGGGVRVERVEVRSRSSGSMARVPQPSAAVERALAMDLEFDPTSVPARVGTVSETRPSTPAPSAFSPRAAHFVPDLELDAPPPSRRPSGPRPAVTPPSVEQKPPASANAHASGAHMAVIDFDDAHGSGGSLDLDLPADEPIARRTVSSAGMRAVQVPTPGDGAPSRRISQPPPPMRDASLPVSGVVPVRQVVSDLTPPSAPTAQAQRRSVPPPAAANPGSLDMGFVAKVEVRVPEEQSLMRRLRLALGLLGVSLSVTLFDPLYAALTGEKLEILGFRPSLFGGVLLLVALALAGREVFREP
jgi:hypothetical protein